MLMKNGKDLEREEVGDRIKSALIHLPASGLVNSYSYIPGFGFAASMKPTRVAMDGLDFFPCPILWDRSMSTVYLALNKVKLSSNSID